MIWITQWLCPRRHCSIALLWDPAERTEESIRAQGEAFYKTGAINRYCGICAGDLEPESRRTIWRTMEEAEREGRKAEAANLASRAAIDEIKKGNKN